MGYKVSLVRYPQNSFTSSFQVTVGIRDRCDDRLYESEILQFKPLDCKLLEDDDEDDESYYIEVPDNRQRRPIVTPPWLTRIAHEISVMKGGSDIFYPLG